MQFFKVLLLIFPVALFSCTGQRAVTNNYLLNVTDTSGTSLINLAEPVIQKNDLLSIKVYSQGGSVDPRVDAPYNLPEQTIAGSSTTSGSAGFLVNASGDIEYPQLGTLHVEGLKKAEVALIIKGKLDTVLKNPSVIIRFLNYRITILGEVRSPGAFTIPTERITILEALGMAGDVTDYGNKNTVRILREKEGKLEIGIVDLTSKNFFSSPYFRLQQNDVVLVEQTRRKIQQEERSNIAQQIGITTSIITAVAFILSFIR
jgi:polysaccharide export outer membrane protein